MPAPTLQLNTTDLRYGTEAVNSVAEILRNRLNMVIDVDPLETNGFPMQALQNSSEFYDPEVPYWLIWWNSRTSSSQTFGTLNYCRQKVYVVRLRGFWPIVGLKSRVQEWALKVEEIADWIESHRSLFRRTKIMLPPEISELEIRELEQEGGRYCYATIEFEVQINDRVTRN